MRRPRTYNELAKKPFLSNVRSCSAVTVAALFLVGCASATTDPSGDVFAQGVPSGWTDADIGTVGTAGLAGSIPAFQVFGIRAAGADIWGTSDAFHFVYQPMVGDGTIAACVTALEPIDSTLNDWAKAGVMIRETLDARSPNALVAATANKGVVFQHRTAEGGASMNMSGSGAHVPHCTKLVRNGSSFSGFESADGVTWTLIGTDSISMSETVFVGLALTSHNDPHLAQALFDRVSTTISTAAPSPDLAVAPSVDLGTPPPPPRDMEIAHPDSAVRSPMDAAVPHGDLAVGTGTGMVPAVPALSAMVLSFNDEFDGAANSQPDKTKWQFSFTGSNQIDYGGKSLVDITLPHLDGNGVCVLPGIFRGGDATNPGNYSTGSIITKGQSGSGFKVAPSAGNNVYIEWRAKLPAAGPGVWPALWAITPNANPYTELDIMEQGTGIGPTPPFDAYGTYWTGASGPSTKIGGFRYAAAGRPDLSLDFHSYSVLWTTTQITYYIDGTQVGIFNVPEATEAEVSPIANFQIGGAGGTPNGVGWPRSLLIDYLRVFRNH